jgi:FlaG/FlaF family flagellin (archaellin)
MIVRAREQPAAHRSGAPTGDDDSGVSPVIGMILVLAISVVGIAAILYWGLPAIDEMKANVEYRSVQTQFGELDGTIRELVAGTTEKTAKRWQPSINRGSITVMNDTEPWLYATELYNGTAWHNFTYGAFEDGDNSFKVYNHGVDLTQAYVQAYLVTGTTALTTLNVSASSASSAQMTESTIGAWTNGSAQTFHLWKKDVPTAAQNLKYATFKIQVWNHNTLLAEAWYTNTTSISYQLSGVTEKSVVYNNGAIIAQAAGTATITNTPSIPPVTNTTGTPRFFGRLVTLNGTAAFSGENRFDLLISLYGTATLASYDCQLANKTDCVNTAKLFIWGENNATWLNYLQRTGLGYGMKQVTPGGAELADVGVFLQQREWKMSFTLLESNVRMVG